MFPEEPLRCIETNAAGEESDATLWGIRFDLLCLSLSGVAVSAVSVAALLWLQRLSLSGAIFAALPAAATLGFAWFKQTHPPGYDSDLLDLWLRGPGFGPKPPFDAMP